MDTLIKIAPHEDYDLIEDIEEREEAQEQFEDEIDKIYCYLKAEEESRDFIDIDQIDDTRIILTVNQINKKVAEAYTDEIICNVENILKKYDVCFAITES